MSLKDQVTNAVLTLAQSPKTAGTISAATVASGTGTYLDLIPDDIGKLATLIGIILSIVLIYTHLRKSHLEVKHAKLQMQIMQRREEDRRREIKERKSTGAPVRRAEDKVKDHLDETG